MTTFFKIRHKPSGLFSKGGCVDYSKGDIKKLSSKGKTWSGLGPLRSHLGIARYSSDFEIIECEISIINTFTVAEQENIAAANRAKREAREAKRMAEYKKQCANDAMKRAQAELDRIAKQYPELVKGKRKMIKQMEVEL